MEPFIGKDDFACCLRSDPPFHGPFYAANDELFHERFSQHRILDCHGDLHLDHVHITPEARPFSIASNSTIGFVSSTSPTISPFWRWISISNETQLARSAFRNAAREFGDAGLLKLADFYKCYRAFVRGKVESIQTIEPEPSSQRRTLQRAIRYFRLALRYAIAGSEPFVLVVMGRVGTGKTTVAKQLASELDWPLFSSDQIRKILAAVPLTIRTSPELREKIYSNQMTQQTYEKLVEEGLAALAVHSGVVLDATFSSRRRRDCLRDQCNRAGIRLQVIELEADRNAIATRLKQRDENAVELSDARLEDLEKLSAGFEPPDELPALIRVSSSGGIADTVSAVLLHLADKQSSRRNGSASRICRLFLCGDVMTGRGIVDRCKKKGYEITFRNR